jgi:hypothetical protein
MARRAPLFLLPAIGFVLGAAIFIPQAFPDSRTGTAQLAQKRTETAGKVYAQVELRYKSGQAPLDSVYLWSARWHAAERGGGAAVAAAAHLKRMQALEGAVKSQVQSGMASSADALAAEYYRAEAELWVAEAAGK